MKHSSQLQRKVYSVQASRVFHLPFVLIIELRLDLCDSDAYLCAFNSNMVYVYSAMW